MPLLLGWRTGAQHIGTGRYRADDHASRGSPNPELLFDDGVVRDVQYVPGEARASLLLPLDEPAYFAQVRVDDEARTVVWPNGLDLAPEVLHGDHEPDHGLGFHDVTADRQPV